MVELVMVMVILGLLAAAAVPRFFDKESFTDRGAFDEVVTGVRYAQQLAIASGCNVQVNFTSTSFTVQKDCGGGFGSVPHPSQCASNVAGNNLDYDCSTGSANISPTTALTFDRLGAATSVATTQVYSVGSRSFTVHGTSGFIQ